MRVLHITCGSLYGGIESMLVAFARSRSLCPELEPEFAICADGRLGVELESEGAPTHRLGAVRLRHPLALMKARRRLADLLVRGRFDAAICHHVMAQILFAPTVRAAGAPLAFWAHSALSGDHWTQRIASLSVPDLVIYSSRFTAEATPRIFQNVATEVIYPVFAAPRVPHEQRAQVRTELGTSKDAVVIMQSSRLQEWKGHRLLLAALERIEKNLEWECWIAGGPQRAGESRYLASLAEMTRRFGISDRVRFLGQRDDVQHLLTAADIYCQPNTGPEPFGLAFVEAMNARLPVVATAIGGAAEILDDSCGLLVRADDPDALAASLRGLIVDGTARRCLGDAGPRRAAQFCDPAQQADRLMRVLSRNLSRVGAESESHSYIDAETNAFKL